MNLPEILQELVKAQNNADSASFTSLFSENAKVFDEAQTHTGKTEIKAWVEKTTKEYNTKMKPVDFEGNNKKGVLKAEISGTFPGSPLVFTYNFEFVKNKIQSLAIAL